MSDNGPVSEGQYRGALHTAGHLVMASIVEIPLEMSRVWVTQDPADQGCGIQLLHPVLAADLSVGLPLPPEDARRCAMVVAAGWVAEQLVFGGPVLESLKGVSATEDAAVLRLLAPFVGTAPGKETGMLAEMLSLGDYHLRAPTGRAGLEEIGAALIEGRRVCGEDVKPLIARGSEAASDRLGQSWERARLWRYVSRPHDWDPAE